MMREATDSLGSVKSFMKNTRVKGWGYERFRFGSLPLVGRVREGEIERIVNTDG